MPTVRIGGFLCYFVSYDCAEPPHIHLAKGKDRTAPSVKFWLSPLSEAQNKGFTSENRETFANRMEVAAAVGRTFESAASFPAARQARLDLLADLIEAHVDVDSLLDLIDGGPPAGLPILPPGDAR